LSDAVSEKKQGALSGFKQFLMRGNVIDLAVAVVIGAAFTSIVNSVVTGVINPVVGAFGTKDLASYRSCLKAPCNAHEGVYILWGSVLGAALNFLITAAVVYFLMVLPMARFLARRAAKAQQETEAPAEQETPEVALLREIRDALVAQGGSQSAAALIAQRGAAAGNGQGPGSDAVGG
jgi:large conductance mechanosensitive channel